MVNGVLFDLGGVLYVGDQLLPGARDALVSLQAAGIPARFLTNTTRLTRQGVVDKLARLGLVINKAHIFTPAMAARDYLRARQLVPHLLVHPRLKAEFHGFTGRPNAVLLGDAGEVFTYQTLNEAFRLLMNGAPLLALGRNRYFQERQALSLDAGPFVVALEYAAGVESVVLGKPAADFFQAAVDSLELPPEQVVMVGDDAACDVEGALEAGLQGILLRTGKYRSGDEERILPRGGEVCDDLDEALDRII
ncbi:MAG: TIGR01458 family HAD-type hydrolase [Candidatus Competibacteraceae bacterium]|nr:TIGR01458 family HAD-type hydrolase [Candidatus Competibacteraceae bacterium]